MESVTGFSTTSNMGQSARFGQFGHNCIGEDTAFGFKAEVLSHNFRKTSLDKLFEKPDLWGKAFGLD